LENAYEYEHPATLSVSCGALSLVLLVTWPALAYTGQKLAKEAKVRIVQARAIALKAHPGKITDEELEREPAKEGPHPD
jgi:hypothetical protein